MNDVQNQDTSDPVETAVLAAANVIGACEYIIKQCSSYDGLLKDMLKTGLAVSKTLKRFDDTPVQRNFDKLCQQSEAMTGAMAKSCKVAQKKLVHMKAYLQQVSDRK